MKPVKAISMALLFLIPALLAAGLLLVFLLAIGYRGDAGIEIGALQLGIWTFCCWLYFKHNGFRWASLVLLSYSIIGLLVKAA